MLIGDGGDDDEKDPSDDTDGKLGNAAPQPTQPLGEAFGFDVPDADPAADLAAPIGDPPAPDPSDVAEINPQPPDQASTWPSDPALAPEQQTPNSLDQASLSPDKETPDLPSGEETPEASDLDSPAQEPDPDAADAGRDLMLGPDDGDVSLAGFRPGIDVLDIEVKDDEVIGFRSLDPETGDPQLRLFHGEGEQVITFAGLGQVPIEDIFLLLTDPDSGDPISMALADFLFDEANALDPISPDEPSVITPAEEDDPGLDPIAPETPPVIEPQEPSAAQSDPVAQPDEAVEQALSLKAQAAAVPLRVA